MDYFHLAQDIDQWQTLVNTVMNFRVPYNIGNFLSGWTTVGFLRTRPRGVIHLWITRTHERAVTAGGVCQEVETTPQYTAAENATCIIRITL
jgi:hypothetical protein